MPVYDYKCKDHGVFQELATMADHDKPCPLSAMRTAGGPGHHDSAGVSQNEFRAPTGIRDQ